jgi:thioredoxin 1
MANLKLTKFGHEYCNPCKVMKPILAEIVNQFGDKLQFEDVDTYNSDPKVLIDAGIRAVPTLILSKDGNEIWRHIGLTNKAVIETKINENL